MELTIKTGKGAAPVTANNEKLRNRNCKGTKTLFKLQIKETKRCFQNIEEHMK